ncbi:MAG: ankyrin repeat domain-containing protein, partial [Pirellulaceae bacterium]|nr:ankyrin repeat domain-containing protein [Pirellulaceae bacterium]
TAAIHGRIEIAEYLIESKARIEASSEDGNTALHMAAILCRSDMVKLLLENGAPVTKKNKRGQSALDVVAVPWSERLASSYKSLANKAGLELDLKQIEKDRPRIAQLLREHSQP